jgi:hypothetical protein
VWLDGVVIVGWRRERQVDAMRCRSQVRIRISFDDFGQFAEHMLWRMRIRNGVHERRDGVFDGVGHRHQ